MKWNFIIKAIAGDIKSFIGYLTTIGFDEKRAWKVPRYAVEHPKYLRIHDAPRKRRGPVRKIGTRARTIFYTING